jgi:uncharacterized membrane protein
VGLNSLKSLNLTNVYPNNNNNNNNKKKNKKKKNNKVKSKPLELRSRVMNVNKESRVWMLRENNIYFLNQLYTQVTNTVTSFMNFLKMQYFILASAVPPIFVLSKALGVWVAFKNSLMHCLAERLNKN